MSDRINRISQIFFCLSGRKAETIIRLRRKELPFTAETQRAQRTSFYHLLFSLCSIPYALCFFLFRLWYYGQDR